MKPPIFLLIFVASFSALLALPLSIELAVSPIVLSGLLLLLRGDYGPRRAPLPLCRSRCAARREVERLRLAA